MTLTHAKIGMDVEIRGQSGRWMIVALLPNRRARVAGLDWPGEVRLVGLEDLREAWPPAHVTPIERLADGR